MPLIFFFKHQCLCFAVGTVRTGSFCCCLEMKDTDARRHGGVLLHRRVRLFNPVECRRDELPLLPLLCDRSRERWRGRRERGEDGQRCNCFSLLLLLVPSACLAPFSLTPSLSVYVSLSLRALSPAPIHLQPPLLVFHLCHSTLSFPASLSSLTQSYLFNGPTVPETHTPTQTHSRVKLH